MELVLNSGKHGLSNASKHAFLRKTEHKLEIHEV